MNDIESRIRELSGQLVDFCPIGCTIELTVRPFKAPPDIQISIYGLVDYAAATELCRTMGVGQRTKSVYNDHALRSVLNGKIAPDIRLTVYCMGLPASCHLETFKERIPKTLVREEDTGEFITVERTRVVCGNGEA